MGTEVELTKHSTGLQLQKMNSCVTIFRDPISRILSCFYFRFTSELNLAASKPSFSCINNMTDDEIVDVLLNGRSRYGRGCLNEPFRIFSGVLDEDMINTLNSSSAEAASIYKATRVNVDSCLLLDFAFLKESCALLDHFFPSLQGMLGSLKHLQASNISRCDPDRRVKMLLFKLSRLERRLYKHVTRHIKHAYLNLMP